MSGKSVIIIDDEFMKTKELGSLLSSDGFNVRVASSKDEAVDLTIKMMPSLIMIKAILIDASEFDIIRGLRSLDALKIIPIVMITESEEDYNDISVISKYKPDYGIIKVIQIPIDAEEFLSLINSILSHDNDDVNQIQIEQDDQINYNSPSHKNNQEGFYNTLQDNIEGERKNMAENRKVEIDEENDPRIHYEDNDFNEVSENELKPSSGKLSGILDMVKTKKILPVLMIGVVIIIFASLIVTKISNKQSVEKNKLTDPSREILTIVEPPDKKPLTPSENIAAQKMSKNPLVGKEIAKNDTQEIVEGKDKALPQQAVKPEEAAKPASPVTPVKVEQQPSSNNKTPEADVEKAQPTIKTDAPVEAKPVQKPKLKAAHKDTETKHPVTAVKAVQKPTKLTHSTKPAIIDRGKEQAVAHANATTPHKKIAAPTSPKPLKASAAKDKAAASTPITSKPESNSSQAYCVQVGLFSNSANAISLLNKLQANNHQGVIKEIHKKNKTLYRVSTGKFNTMKEAKAVALQLKTVNKIDAIVVK